MRLFHAARARLRLLARRNAEARMNDEMRFHIDMEAERIARDEGVAPDEARRRAVIAFGIAEQHKDAMRDGRGRGWIEWVRGLSLDFTLGLRMLAKYPGLSLVSVVGMAVAIAIGSGAFSVMAGMVAPSLPLDEGDRIVSVQNANLKNPDSQERRSLHDLALWRGRLTRLRDIGGWRDEERTVVYPDGRVELIEVAFMSASGFRVARVAPALGRTLLDADEREDAPPVLVLTHEEWQSRFGADSGIIGRTMKIGDDAHVIVGVMPAGFRFPVNHRYWAPLRLDPADFEPGRGPTIRMFARLAPGATMEAAQAEIDAVGVAARDERRDLRPLVLPYTHPFFDLDTPAMAMAFYGIQLAISLLLVVVAVNVAVLVYARTAARAGEIAVRTALGASRRRVVGQLFTEAFVMAGVAAVLGLGLAQGALAMVERMQGKGDGGEMPFWVELGLSPALVLYVVALTILASVIVGVLPALKATGKDVQAGLKELSARGSRMQLGRTWTTLIVAQVAIAVAVLPYAAWVAGQSIRNGSVKPRFATAEVLRTFVRFGYEPAPNPRDSAATEAWMAARTARFVARVEELSRRLEADPAIAGVTFASHFPGQEADQHIEAEGGGTRSVESARVDPGLLDVLGVRLLAGRGLRESDVRPDLGPAGRAGATEPPATGDASTALVNDVFAEWLGATGPVLGRRIRTVNRTQDDAGVWHEERGPWIEVVGVMPTLAAETGWGPADAKMFVPTSLAAAADGYPWVVMGVRVRRRDAAPLIPHVRAVAAAVDPMLQLGDLRTVENHQWEDQTAMRMVGYGVAMTTLSVLLLSAAGIYAMMSFTVVRRRREIGIRTALGATTRGVLRGIFARASAQIGTGVAVGLALAAVGSRFVGDQMLGGQGALLLPVAGVTMLVIGVLAALGPARRGLAVQPTEALREE